MKLNVLAVLLSVFLIQSCSKIYQGKYRGVHIQTPPQSTVYIDGNKPLRQEGIYLVDKRKSDPVQAVIKREGYKDEHVAVYFEKTYDIGGDMIVIPKRDENAKEIYLDKISFSVEKKDMKYNTYANYDKFKNKTSQRSGKSRGNPDALNIKETVFDAELNETLKSKGYIDTANRTLKNSYLNNLIIAGEVNSTTVNLISYEMISMDVAVEWKIKNFYDKQLLTFTTQTSSGTFAAPRISDLESAAFDAMKDALKLGLIKVLKRDEMNELFYDRSQVEVEESYTNISIPSPKKTSSSVSEGVQASVTIKNKEGHGSGFFISPEGHIITNYHVIANDSDIEVITHDQKSYKAEVIRVSKIRDLALLKIEKENLIPLQIDDGSGIKIAREVYAVGTPSGEDLTQSVSKGIISGIRTNDSDNRLIQTDVSVNPGSSGGPLIDEKGKALGIMSAKLSGYGVEGVAFAIPTNEIFEALKINFK